jgi:pheromone shutdown protein TraB
MFSVLLLMLIAASGGAKPPPYRCHRRSSFYTAFIASSPSFHRDVTATALSVSSNEENTDCNDVLLGRRRWIRDMIVFGSSSIAAARGASASTATAISSPSPSNTYITSSPSILLCDPTIESYRKGSNKIHIIGTAHVSSASATLAGEVVKEIQPTAVFLELDPQRINRAFRNGRINRPINILYFVESKGGQVTLKSATLLPQDFEKNKKGLFGKLMAFAAKNPIQEMYEGLEAQGITPGEEFITAVEAGIQSNSIIVLGDRPMDITLRRLAKALLFDTDPKKLVEADKVITQKMKDQVPEIKEWERHMKESGQEMKELSSDEFTILVERLKTKEMTMTLMNEVKKASPALYQALVGERDVFMSRAMDTIASSLSSLIMVPSLSEGGVEMISVVGLGHVDGIGSELMTMGWSKFSPANCR